MAAFGQYFRALALATYVPALVAKIEHNLGTLASVRGDWATAAGHYNVLWSPRSRPRIRTGVRSRTIISGGSTRTNGAGRTRRGAYRSRRGLQMPWEIVT